MRSVGARRVTVGLVLGAALLLGGCARFDDSASSPFTPEPTLDGAQLEPKKPQPGESSTTRPSGPCIDPDPAVVVSCLDTTGGIVEMGGYALVAERRTGRILQVAPEQQPVEVARVDVDPAGDGGLSDIAVSPTYPEDGLLYAYVTTGSDNRVVRIADGGPPKPVLTGIPKGSTGNRGAIEWSSAEQMLVLTGDAGDPASASDPGSTAGKLLRVNNPTTNGNAPTEVAVSGIGSAGDICLGGDQIWITDRTPALDRLQRIGPDGAVTTAWTWPDRPGVAGCAVTPEGVAISLTDAKALAMATPDPATFAITAPPSVFVANKYGRLLGAAPAMDGTIWVTTANKSEGGQPTPNDDRVVRIPPPSAGGGGPD